MDFVLFQTLGKFFRARHWLPMASCPAPTWPSFRFLIRTSREREPCLTINPPHIKTRLFLPARPMAPGKKSHRTAMSMATSNMNHANFLLPRRSSPRRYATGRGKCHNPTANIFTFSQQFARGTAFANSETCSLFVVIEFNDAINRTRFHCGHREIH